MWGFRGVGRMGEARTRNWNFNFGVFWILVNNYLQSKGGRGLEPAFVSLGQERVNKNLHVDSPIQKVLNNLTDSEDEVV
jgi:hypothetical protein